MSKEIKNKELNLITDDSDSSRDTQIINVKGLDHITDEIRESIMGFIKDKIVEIKNQEKNIKYDIKNLSQTIEDILDKNHKDFISTFSNFMDSVRKDLKLKLEQMEKIEEEKRKINDIKTIKCERDYFRLEAIRLSKMTTELKNKIDDMSLKMKLLDESVNNLKLKLKDSEGVNKQLLLELEKNIETQKDIEKELLMMKGLYSKENERNPNIKSEEDTEDNKLLHSETHSTQVYEIEKKIQENNLLKEYINRLKYELKKEKNRSHIALGELNKI